MTAGCRKEADLLLFNGSIYTVNNQSDIVSAMVILDGHVIAIGKEDRIAGKIQGRPGNRSERKIRISGIH